MNDQVCDTAAILSQEDLKTVQHQSQYVMACHNGNKIVTILQQGDKAMLYKLKPRNDTLVLKIKSFLVSPVLSHIDAVDVENVYRILKSRGCEDYRPHFAKTTTLNHFATWYQHYHNVDNIEDIVYLYMVLHANVALMLSTPVIKTKLVYDMNHNTPHELLHEVDTLYNTLITTFVLNHS